MGRASSFGQLYSSLLALDRCGCEDGSLYMMRQFSDGIIYFVVTPFPLAITLSVDVVVLS